MAELRVLSNSSMWQSERWNNAVTKINRPEGVLATLRLAWRLVRQRRHFDVVYTVGVREAQMYGLLSAILGNAGKPHVAAEILLDERQPQSLKWRMKQRLRRFALRRVRRMIVFSSGERELYARELTLPLERVVFVPFHTNIVEPAIVPGGLYGFAAGRSLRDYKTFFAAVEGLPERFAVVADRSSVAGLKTPANVELQCDVPRKEYLEMLQAARFVVVPLKAEYRSTGQVVVLEAASLGKPVIASDVVGVRDYIANGEDGLLVPPGDPEALRGAIERVSGDPALAERLAQNAMARVLRDHTFDRFAERCLAVMAEAAAEDRE
jgi:glycosyltransferase involved in cell wall biosynthesis